MRRNTGYNKMSCEICGTRNCVNTYREQFIIKIRMSARKSRTLKTEMNRVAVKNYIRRSKIALLKKSKNLTLF